MSVSGKSSTLLRTQLPLKAVLAAVAMAWDLLVSRRMTLETPCNTPRFKAGDAVTIQSPGQYKGKSGVVVNVIGHTGDFVYRYEVLFADGIANRFFGFEIENLICKSA